ncbi:BTAD domain-containing putative transcriptional regulator [Actinokineospora iranica]|uniref:DNA-binding transcriptional activator of the SARP family n=1 Tax=Actinokineospora iranica TaxID=1271860 RepID=A0A1G6XBQ1_9PSEU|nr:BTAD domain-containing putative transcriptional regulator [Actinokineospora iranica]SDD75492.1 DNA-binding transcriptional activator of the SARP family [Actinokineospora iranica]
MTANNSASLRIDLLGQPVARRAGVELELGSARRRAVFSVLAVRAGDVVTREQLIDAVWDGVPPASAAAIIQTYVSDLRRALEPRRERWSAGEVLTTTGGGYRLLVADSGLDIRRFAALREQAGRHRRDGDPVAERAALERALALWRGEALAGVPGPFAHGQRVRLTELRLATWERRAALLLQAGEHDELVGELPMRIHENPFREELHGLLMTALARGGRRAEALAVYRAARETLAGRTGVEPGTALRGLHERILAGEPVGDGDPVARPRAGGAEAVSARPTRFIGRRFEVSRLRAAVAAVAAGRGGCVWIEGERGIGKTAVLTEGLAGAERAGCGLVWATGDEVTGTLPLAAAIAPGQESLTSLGNHGNLGSPEDILALVRARCGQAPQVLVLDDAQWADAATVALGRLLHRLTATLPLLLVVASRSTGGRAPDRLRAPLVGGGAEVLRLRQLTDEQIRDLVWSLAPRHADAELVAFTARQAGGNPLYARAVVAAVVDEGMATDDAATPPPGLAETVRGHLDALPEGAYAALRSAALLGDACGVGELAAAMGLPVERVLPDLDSAIDAGVLVVSWDRLRFRHPVVRRVLRGGIPGPIRAVLHRQLAESLAAAAAPPERVAEQLLAGAARMDAWACAWLANNVRQMSEHAPDTAIDLLRHTTEQSCVPPVLRAAFTSTLVRLLLNRTEAASRPRSESETAALDLAARTRQARSRRRAAPEVPAQRRAAACLGTGTRSTRRREPPG